MAEASDQVLGVITDAILRYLLADEAGIVAVREDPYIRYRLWKNRLDPGFNRIYCLPCVIAVAREAVDKDDAVESILSAIRKTE